MGIKINRSYKICRDNNHGIESHKMIAEFLRWVLEANVECERKEGGKVEPYCFV